MKFRPSILLLTISAMLSACGGSNSGTGTPPPPGTFVIGGSVSGMSGAGLMLQDNGGDNLSISANGAFTFETAVAPGGAYAVTVLIQPSGLNRVCTVTDGSGTANANVTNVQVECSAAPSNEWTWVGGPNTSPQLGVYGSLGVPAPTNFPGSRTSSVHWLDAQGNLWLFGGIGHASTGGQNNLNDLWKYSLGEWTWMSGSNLAEQPGVYGTKGVAGAANVPSSRTASVGWIDSSGALWLLGGYGLDSSGNVGELNDLWKFSSGEWTWVAGSDKVNQSGIYGSIGTSAAGNFPGGRDSAFSWKDLSGNFWLFGGDGVDSNGAIGQLNDLWKYSSGQWTWIGGAVIVNQPGIYGTQGVPSPGNFPGARDSGASSTDSAGAFWLFGGRIETTRSKYADTYNDLWKYSEGQWTWLSGANVVDQPGVYGTKGVADPANVPGARRDAVGIPDAAGNFWVFGGDQDWNDLWKYSGGEWTWVNGSDLPVGLAVYGTPGIPAPDNVPGGRNASVAWIDPDGNIWIFGGFGI